jgi:hypothetical protein
MAKPKPEIDEDAKLEVQKKIRAAFKGGSTPRDVFRMFNAEIIEEIIVEAIFGNGISKSNAVDKWAKYGEIDKIKGAKPPLKFVPVTLEQARANELRKAEERKYRFDSERAAQG